MSITPEQAEAVVDAGLDLVDEVTRLRAEVARLAEERNIQHRDLLHLREARSFETEQQTANIIRERDELQAEVARLQAQRLEDAERVRSACIAPFDALGSRDPFVVRTIAALDLAAVLGVGRG